MATTEQQPTLTYTRDPDRPGIVWGRHWYRCRRAVPGRSAWGGHLWTYCEQHHDTVEGRWFYDDAQEVDARAVLELVADAHRLAQHGQPSLFDGCGCR